MRKQARLLLERALNSLLLAIEHFNRPSDRGRIEAVLIHLDHSFEMLLKAAILHLGGRIREPRAKQTIGFDKCVRKCVSDAKVKCLTEDQALTLRMINGLRDSTMHYIIEISEQQLYVNAQAGVTLFDDILRNVFHKSLSDYLPHRVLPISTKPPTDLMVMMDEQFGQIRSLVAPGRRRRTEARARVRPIAVMENAVLGESRQPAEGELNRLLNRVAAGESWTRIFPGTASLKLDTEGAGLTFNIRISKKEGLPIRLVKEGEAEAALVAVRRVDELGFYNLGLFDLAAKIGLTSWKTLAVIWYLKMRENPEYYKEFVIGKTRHKRYSRKAIEYLREQLPRLDIDAIWAKYRARQK